MPYNLLLLPLLAGYWFLCKFRVTRFKFQRLDGYRLLVESAFHGAGFAVAAWFVGKLAAQVPGLLETWKAVAPAKIPFLGTACASLVFGAALPYVLNWLLDKTGILTAEEARQREVTRYGNCLLRLLYQAASEEKPVMITLDSRKVYIGAVVGAPNLEPHDPYISLIPFFSGYRHSQTLKLALAVDYLEVYAKQDLDPSGFLVVLPVASIHSASLFDQSVYPYFEIDSAPERA